MVDTGSAERKIDDIEVLRAVAVTFVVLHHINGNLWPGAVAGGTRFFEFFGGWVGVDLFFAVSGFVIARSLLPQIRAARSMRGFWTAGVSFWIRRAFRLLPSAWFWLAAVLVLQVLFNDSGVFGTLRANIEATVAAVLQVANIRFAWIFGRAEPGTSFVYWSLSLEEQFYIVFPILAFYARRYLPWLLAVALLVQFPLARGLFAMAFRTDAICWGVLIALLGGYGLDRKMTAIAMRFTVGTRVLVCSALVGLPLLGGDLCANFAQKIGCIAFASALLVWFASRDAGCITEPLPAPIARIAVWLGASSYAIYLIHIPAYFIVREAAFRAGIRVADFPWLSVLAAAMLILALAEVNYRWLESPLRRHGHRVAQKFGEARATAAMVTEESPHHA